MLKNKDKVLAKLETIRSNAQDYFIPLGGSDHGTTEKKEISNLTMTLRRHVQTVDAMVTGLENKPVYVGYDGRNYGNRTGTYSENTVILHDIADESTKDFIMAYTHELTHADQDRRGLLREHEAPENPSRLVDFLVHNLALEAAAFATEAISLYYVSNHTSLPDVDEEVAEYFNEYCYERQGREALPFLFPEKLKDTEVNEMADMKDAWRAAFMTFFEPDSKHVQNYLGHFCQDYLRRLQHRPDENGTALKKAFNDRAWGDNKSLKAITKIPGMGQMFGKEGLDILQQVIRGSIVREKNLPLLDLARSQAPKPQKIDGAQMLDFLNNLQDDGPKP